MRLPGGQMQPVWSRGVAATTCSGKVRAPSIDFETISPAGIWWVTWYTTLLPVVAIHCRSWTIVPSTGLASHELALSVDDDTVLLPSHRSVMNSAPVAGSMEMSESPPPGKLARRLAGVCTKVAPPSVDRNTGLGEPGRFDSRPEGPLT